MNAKATRPRVAGYEILKRVTQADAPGFPVDPRRDRGVLGTQGVTFFIPPGIDLFELGVIVRAGRYELLPVTADEKPLWDGVVHVLVTEAEAERQRGILFRSYDALCAMIREADELEHSVAECSRRGGSHPIFGMLRLAAIEIWKARRRGCNPLSERERAALHASVARRVAARIRAHLIC